jgi:hypothetical protein
MANLNLSITKTTVLHRKGGPDYIYLQTELPPPMPNLTKQSLLMTFQCAAGKGEEYCRANLHLEPDDIIPECS